MPLDHHFSGKFAIFGGSHQVSSLLASIFSRADALQRGHASRAGRKFLSAGDFRFLFETENSSVSIGIFNFAAIFHYHNLFDIDYNIL